MQDKDIDKGIICFDNIEHVIWDYNGTMLDDVDLCVDVINLVMSKRNLKPITKLQYQEAFDFPVKDYYERVGFDFTKESFEIVGTEFIEEYNKLHNKYKLHDFTEQTLKVLAGKRIGQSVLSARLKESLEKELVYFGIDRYFENIFGLDDHYADGKFEIGKKLVEKLDVNPDHILFIGDTLHDMEIARRLGCRELLISGGHHTFDKLSRHTGNVINSVHDLYLSLDSKDCLEINKKGG